MKTSSLFCVTLATIAATFSLVSGQAASSTNALAAPSSTNAPVALSSTNAPAAATNSVPKSVFNIPASKKEGCDPFYPTSTRVWGVTISTNASAPKEVKSTGIDCLVLKGLGGAPSNPLAMINSRTMARGEDAEINTDCGRLFVHCVDITATSAIVEVAGERKELHLRSDL